MGGGNDNFIIGIRERNANAALSIEGLGGQAAGSDAFGGAVAFPDLLLGAVGFQECIHLVLELNGQGVAAGEYALQLAKVQIPCLFQPQQRLIQGGDAGDIVGLMLFQQLGIAFRRKLRHQNTGGTVDEYRVDADAQTKAVENGHDGQHLVPLYQAVARGTGLKPQRVKVQVAEKNALGGAGGTAGFCRHGENPSSKPPANRPKAPSAAFCPGLPDSPASWDRGGRPQCR